MGRHMNERERETYTDGESLAQKELPVLSALRYEESRNNQQHASGEKWDLEISEVEHPTREQRRQEHESIL